MTIRDWAASLFVAGILFGTEAITAEKDWVTRSNEHSSIVLEALAKFSPEGAGSLGVDGFDEAVSDFGPKIHERNMADLASLQKELQERLAAETHAVVRQDIQILLKAVEDSIRTTQLTRDNMLPYYNISQQVFGGIRALIDPQVSRERYPAAVVRLRRYAGLDDGYEPITEQARARTEERFDVEGLQGPYRDEVEQDLERSETFISGIEELLAGTDLQEWQKPYATLASQLHDYNEWVRAEILPRARDDFRLPPAMYEDALRNWGVDASPEELIQTATQGYMDIRNEMDVIGALVAKEKGYGSSDYRDVIRKLKEDGAIDGDELVEHYQQVLAKIEKFIRSEHLISLPERPAGIRIATAAETAAQPAPHLDPPRMIGNTGEYPFFVIPLIEQNADGSWPQTDGMCCHEGICWDSSPNSNDCEIEDVYWCDDGVTNQDGTVTCFD
jgi:hypothetical protein